MDRTGCTEPQCLYKGIIYLHFTLFKKNERIESGRFRAFSFLFSLCNDKMQSVSLHPAYPSSSSTSSPTSSSSRTITFPSYHVSYLAQASPNHKSSSHRLSTWAVISYNENISRKFHEQQPQRTFNLEDDLLLLIT